MKTIEEHFIDWESYVFGYGYGTGEEHTLKALKVFMAAIPERTYDFQVLEKAASPTVAWLLINTLCRAEILEYGTSPRYGWLRPQGELLKKFLDSHSVEQLYDITSVNEEYTHCAPDHCNCDGVTPNTKCKNPFFK